MAIGYNKGVFVGRPTTDPDFIEGNNSTTKRSTFTLAVPRTIVGEDGVSADFFKVIAWNRLADIVIDYVKKGNPLLVEGKVQINNYKNKKGEWKHFTNIMADKIVLLGTKKDSDTTKVNKPIVNNKNPFTMDGVTITTPTINNNEDVPF
jgi:single-strand DNA-binding protein